VIVESAIRSTPRVLQLRGLFDLPEAKISRLEWEVALPLDERPWQIGLIVGPSGCGKSTIAAEFWPEQLAAEFVWPADGAVVDGFPEKMPMKDVAALLSSVGFSSPPSWLRPFHALSNGEKFRVTMARLLAEQPELAVVDEFTSVVDRTVAKIGSLAIAKTVRRRKQRLIAVSCHEDIVEWLQPDWIYRPATGEFTWGCLQPRPGIDLEIRRVDRRLWPLFAPYHYLDGGINPSAICFAAFWEGQPVAFAGWLADVGRRGARRLSRSVCLPDFQGAGIGLVLNEQTAAMWKGMGIKPRITSTHPAIIAALNRSPKWAMTRKPGFARHQGATSSIKGELGHASRRRTASFQYVGPALERAEALALRAGKDS
jgi:ABC-type thiamine transport system ATPase subunit